VVQVCDVEAQIQRPRQAMQQVQQRDRIRPAGDAHHDPLSRLQESVCFDVMLNVTQ
jgi:hypothetical protein